MAGFANAAALASLDMVTGKGTSTLTAAARYMALLTAVGTDAGTGFTEVSGGGYARVQIPLASWASATGSAPSSSSTSAAVSFGNSTGDQTNAGASPVIAWALMVDTSAISGTNLVAWDYLGNFSWLPCSISSASPGVVTAPAHGYSVGDPVVFTTEFGGAAPTASAGTLSGLLRVTAVTTDTFSVASGATFTNGALTGGTAVNTSTSGSGCIRKVAPQLVPNNSQVTFASGAIVLTSG